VIFLNNIAHATMIGTIQSTRRLNAFVAVSCSWHGTTMELQALSVLSAFPFMSQEKTLAPAPLMTTTSSNV